MTPEEFSRGLRSRLVAISAMADQSWKEIEVMPLGEGVSGADAIRAIVKLGYNGALEVIGPEGMCTFEKQAACLVAGLWHVRNYEELAGLSEGDTKT